MQFPRLVFRSPGPEQCQGGTYAHACVRNQDELDNRLADGWHATLPEALQPKPVPVSIAADTSALDVSATSDDIRRKAIAPGLKVRANASDESILAAVKVKLIEG